MMKTFLAILFAVIAVASTAQAQDRKAIVENGTGAVKNVIVTSPGFQAPAGHSLVDAANAAIGDTWNGSAFVKPAPPTQGEIDTAKNNECLKALNSAVNNTIVDALLSLENRVRTIQVQPTITRNQYITANGGLRDICRSYMP